MHTQAAPVTSGVIDSPTRRRQAHTHAGSATSGARGPVRPRQTHELSAGRRQGHPGCWPGDVRRTRTALVRPRRRPGNLKRTQNVSVRPRRRGQPPSAHTDHPYVGPCPALHGLATTGQAADRGCRPRRRRPSPSGRRGPPPQTKAVTFRQAKTAPTGEGRHLPADEDRPRRRRLPLLTTRLTRAAASTPPGQGGTQSQRFRCLALLAQPR
jgi:hypothetical protein